MRVICYTLTVKQAREEKVLLGRSYRRENTFTVFTKNPCGSDPAVETCVAQGLAVYVCSCMCTFTHMLTESIAQAPKNGAVSVPCPHAHHVTYACAPGLVELVQEGLSFRCWPGCNVAPDYGGSNHLTAQVPGSLAPKPGTSADLAFCIYRIAAAGVRYRRPWVPPQENKRLGDKTLVNSHSAHTSGVLPVRCSRLRPMPL